MAAMVMGPAPMACACVHLNGVAMLATCTKLQQPQQAQHMPRSFLGWQLLGISLSMRIVQRKRTQRCPRRARPPQVQPPLHGCVHGSRIHAPGTAIRPKLWRGRLLQRCPSLAWVVQFRQLPLLGPLQKLQVVPSHLFSRLPAVPKQSLGQRDCSH